MAKVKKVKKVKVCQVAELLMNAGHEGLLFSRDVALGLPEGRITHVWFPSLMLIFKRANNSPISLRRTEEFVWQARKGGSNWYPLATYFAGATERYIEALYIKWLNEKIVGAKDDDDSVPEGRGVQGGVSGSST